MSENITDLHEFISWPPQSVNSYLKSKGWDMIPCFNDYKYVWINILLNKSIIAKIEIVDDSSLGNEMIVDIWCIDFIHSESLN